MTYKSKSSKRKNTVGKTIIVTTDKRVVMAVKNSIKPKKKKRTSKKLFGIF